MRPGREGAPSFGEMLERLRARLARPLPGLAAQLPMAPRPRRPLDRRPRAELPLPAAVTILLYPDEDAGGARFVLTRRTDHVASHKGQICLPGGAVDAGEAPHAAALRELKEELGVATDTVRILGALTPVFIPVSGYRMEPFLAACDARPRFRPAAREVESLIELPLHRLLDPEARREAEVERDGAPAVLPCFDLGGLRVWGATAMVLAELAALLAEIGLADQAPT